MSSRTELMYRFSEFIQQNNDVDKVLEKASLFAIELTGSTAVILALYDNITNELYCRICNNEFKDSANEFVRFEMGQGILGWVAQNRKSLRLQNVKNDSRFNPKFDEKCVNGIKSLLSVPMLFCGKMTGVLQVMNKKSSSSFSRYDEYILSSLATQIAAIVENNRLTEENLNQSLLSDIGQNIASSAHGIKNILNNIDGGTFIVERGVAAHKMDMVDKGWDIMKRNSYRLRELVVDMLLFSRPKKPEYVQCDINKICCDIYGLIKEKAERENVKIELDLDRSIGQVCIDAKGIYRSILNLVSNAIFAFDTRESGFVSTQTKLLNNNYFRIIVSDNGAGISKENLSHIFDVFFTTKGSKGTGLGLPVTKKIITEHEGTIDVSSVPNEGTIFTITIPIKKEINQVNS